MWRGGGVVWGGGGVGGVGGGVGGVGGGVGGPVVEKMRFNYPNPPPQKCNPID
jgi:hypothetical protein